MNWLRAVIWKLLDPIIRSLAQEIADRLYAKYEFSDIPDGYYIKEDLDGIRYYPSVDGDGNILNGN